MDRVKRIHVDCLLGWELFEMVKEEEQKVYKGWIRLTTKQKEQN